MDNYASVEEFLAKIYRNLLAHRVQADIFGADLIWFNKDNKYNYISKDGKILYKPE